VTGFSSKSTQAPCRCKSRIGFFGPGVILRASVRRHEARHCLRKRATCRERPEAGARWAAMLDVINLAAEFRHSTETGKKIHSCWARQ
jgi:hypothetical protein